MVSIDFFSTLSLVYSSQLARRCDVLCFIRISALLAVFISSSSSYSSFFFLLCMIQFLRLWDFPPIVFPYIVSILQSLNNSHKSISLLFKCLLTLQLQRRADSHFHWEPIFYSEAEMHAAMHLHTVAYLPTVYRSSRSTYVYTCLPMICWAHILQEGCLVLQRKPITFYGKPTKQLFIELTSQENTLSKNMFWSVR